VSERNDPLTGVTLSQGRYRIVAKLGEGGMGHVYKAYDRNLDTVVVLKMPRRAMLEDAEFAGRFAREVRALVQLKHPHIVKVSDVGEFDGAPFAVMEYLPGGSLEDRYGLGPDSASRPAEPRDLSGWLPAIAAALDFASAEGYVHRDVKPPNILFDSQGNAFLGDFGVAKLIAASEDKGSKPLMTGTGMVLGTPGYMAPEVILGAVPDGRADQYALGVVVYEVLAGRRPFDDATPTAVLVRQTTTDPPSVNQLRSDLPAALAAVVARAMSRDPNARYPDCASFAREVIATSVSYQPSAGRPTTTASGSGAITRLACPSCNSPLRIPPAAAGKNIRCPTCAAKLHVKPDLTALAVAAPQDGSTASLPALNANTAGYALSDDAPSGGVVARTDRFSPQTIAERRTAPEPRAPGNPVAATVKMAVADSGGANRRDVAQSSAARANPALLAGISVAALAVIGVVGALLWFASRNDLRTQFEQMASESRSPTASNSKSNVNTGSTSRSSAAQRTAAATIPEPRATPIEPQPSSNVQEPKLPVGVGSALVTRTPEPKAESVNPSMRLSANPSLGPSTATSNQPVTVDLKKVKANPADFTDRIVIPEKYVFIGTKVDRLPSGQYTMHILDNDSSTLATGKDLGSDGLAFLVDDGVAKQLLGFLGGKRFPLEYKATCKSVLELRVAKRPINGKDRFTATVEAMEILVGFDYMSVAQGDLTRSFQVLRVSPNYAQALVVDGNDWVARLGGDSFVTKIRNDHKAWQRRIQRNNQQAIASRMMGQMFNQSMKGAAQESQYQEMLRQKLFGR
jgi:serine/threonine-protein kinase